MATELNSDGTVPFLFSVWNHFFTAVALTVVVVVVLVFFLFFFNEVDQEGAFLSAFHHHRLGLGQSLAAGAPVIIQLRDCTVSPRPSSILPPPPPSLFRSFFLFFCFQKRDRKRKRTKNKEQREKERERERRWPHRIGSFPFFRFHSTLCFVFVCLFVFFRPIVCASVRLGEIGFWWCVSPLSFDSCLFCVCLFLLLARLTLISFAATSLRRR